ncbi:NAD(P)H-dependent oxidoreductase [Neolewinella antarctica]|uniref:NAD(P)H dehydrogenase (Quinone) n=1 Tax=Neolewinella antarctica TaxID=442734 RepID=A0ABX0XBI9_9BACT|nr:NAD(P)H-dependent oxidoreductase [Neolewinella antarctica]NJC26625.1 NAD(P)H dehydrogenase (quinone) [Neolewinella antarctica]
MANVLLCLTHPNPDSLNGAAAKSIKEIAEKKGHQVRFKDLYRMDFDSILGMKDFTAWGKGEVPADVKAEQKDFDWADKLVFLYPIWWNERPAKLKGYFDRVLTKPWAWDMNEKGLVQNMTGKSAMVAVTYGSPDGLYDFLTIDQNHIMDNMKKGTLRFCGVDVQEIVETYGVLAEESKPDAHLTAVKEAAERFF